MIKAAFEVWSNGGFQTSKLYLVSEGDDVQGFITSHNESGTFASLETYENEEEAIKAYEAYNA